MIHVLFSCTILDSSLHCRGVITIDQSNLGFQVVSDTGDVSPRSTHSRAQQSSNPRLLRYLTSSAGMTGAEGGGCLVGAISSP